jgi:hypothetical protein
MTGHRKAFGKPLKPVAVIQRSYQSFQKRLTDCATPGARLSVAFSYLQAALSRSDLASADRVAEEIFDVLVIQAQRLDAASAAAATKRKEAS